eukprot:3660478-Amphidinium_carterae.2
MIVACSDCCSGIEIAACTHLFTHISSHTHLRVRSAVLPTSGSASQGAIAAGGGSAGGRVGGLALARHVTVFSSGTATHW